MPHGLGEHPGSLAKGIEHVCQGVSRFSGLESPVRPLSLLECSDTLQRIIRPARFVEM
jgi:hypothetical protein